MAVLFVLASNSPRRRSLLRHAGFDFEVLAPRLEERQSRHLSLGETTLANAVVKARAVSRQRPEAIVLGADTLVSLDGKIIGKPRDLDDAHMMLRRLSGRTHEVCTSVAIATAAGKFAAFSEISHVRFRGLRASAIADYLTRVDPLDKAGAYAAQGVDGRSIISSVQGSFTNVVGLPMERTIEVLARFGIRPRH